uniref:Uncharacterized protein n=1 Tax=Alexandrium andersonii TaxID=327968 RepID=A0A7S2BL22_9DINO
MAAFEPDTSGANAEWVYRFTPGAPVTWCKTQPRKKPASFQSASQGKLPKALDEETTLLPEQEESSAQDGVAEAYNANSPLPPGFEWLPSLALKPGSYEASASSGRTLRRRVLSRCKSAGDVWDHQHRRSQAANPCRHTAIELSPWSAGSCPKTPVGITQWRVVGPGSHRLMPSPQDNRALWRSCWAPRRGEYPQVGSRATCLSSEISMTRREICDG